MKAVRHNLASALLLSTLVMAPTAALANDGSADGRVDGYDIGYTDTYYLHQLLDYDGIATDRLNEKVHADLLATLEADAERAYFEKTEAGQVHSVIIGLHTSENRAERRAALKSDHGRALLQRSVRTAQDRVLRSMSTKGDRGAKGAFQVRNRYQTLAGFSARADFRAIAHLAEHPDVKSIEIMQVFEQSYIDDESDPIMGISAVQNQGTNGSGVTVAVIDSGIDYTHPWLLGHFPAPKEFLSFKVLGGYDFGDDDADPKNDCGSDSHGTSSASIVAGLGTGVAPGASLVHLKVQSASKCGLTSLDGDIPGAIDWVVTNKDTYGIRIINMSLGGGSYSSECTSAFSSSYRGALDDAEAAGILVFASSGNSNTKGAIKFPACYPSVISVGATYDASRGSTTYSNGNGSALCTDSDPDANLVTCYSNSASFLDLLAPGTCIEALKPNSAFTGCFSGTSAAAPNASGIAALLLDKNPNLTPAQVEAYLKMGGMPLIDHANGVATPRVNALMSWLITPPGN